VYCVGGTVGAEGLRSEKPNGEEIMKPRSAVMLALVVLSGAAVAQAQSVNFSTTVPLTMTDFSNYALSLPQWNQVTGEVLQSVTITIAGTGNTRLAIANQAPIPETFSATDSSKISLTGDGLPSSTPFFSQSISAGTGTVTLPAGAGCSGFPPVCTPVYSLFPPSGTYTLTGTPASETITTGLASFIGSGNLTYDMSTANTVTINGGGGNIIAATQTFAGGTVEISYHYAFLPEGGATWIYLLLAGAVCFGAMSFSSRNRLGTLA